MPRIVGIDFGTTAIRLVELEDTAYGQMRVIKSAHIETPLGAITAGSIMQTDVIAILLKKAWKTNRFHTKRVAVSISGRDKSVSMREATVTYSADPESMKVLALKEQNILPVNAKDLHVSHYVVDAWPAPEKDTPDRKEARVALVGAMTSFVNPIIEAIEKAGLTPVSVEAAHVSLTRLLTNVTGQTDEAEYIVHLGDYTGFIVGVINGMPRDMVSLDEHSGSELRRRIVESYDHSESVAEAHKLEASEQVAAGYPATLGALIAESTSSIVGDIWKFMREFESTHGVTSSQIWLTGGAAQLGTLETQLYSETGVPAALTRATEHVATPEKLALADSMTDMIIAVAAGDVK